MRWFVLLVWCLAGVAMAQPVRVAVLKFGTVSWVLDTVLHHGLARQEGVEVRVVPLASKSAIQVAIQGGAADMIVTDWVWVSRQRALGRDYTFAPYSTAAGAVMVDPQRGITRLAELKGRRLGVAGGPLDKSWLLLRAYGRKSLGQDLAEIVEPTFAAPPLLNELALRKELPAVLNYWHYAARLKAAGMDTLISVREVLRGLGVEAPLPLVGWVFHEDWADGHRDQVQAFLRAVAAANRILSGSDAEWQRLRPVIGAPDDRTLRVLREAYRAGIPPCRGEAGREAAQEVFAILAREGGRALVGRSGALSEGTFWTGYETAVCPQ